MACGTTCARAIVEGDDDLLDRYNCLRTAYDYDALLDAGRWLMEDDTLRKRLQDNGLKYAERNLDWDGIVPMIEDAYGVRG